MSDDTIKRKLKLRCPECGRETFVISEDDILHYGHDGIPILDPSKAPGLCEVCRHRNPSEIPPSLDLRDSNSRDEFVNWYDAQSLSKVNYKEMCKARLCALVIDDVPGATHFLAKWILAKANRSRELLQKIGGNPAKLKEDQMARVRPTIKVNMPELSPEEIEDEAEYILDDQLRVHLQIDKAGWGFLIDDLIKEKEFLDRPDVQELLKNTSTFLNKPDRSNQDKPSSDHDCSLLDFEIVCARVWTANEWFVMFLHGCLIDRDFWERNDYQRFNADFLGESSQLTIKLGLCDIDKTLYSLLFAEVWPIVYEKSLALRFVVKSTNAFLQNLKSPLWPDFADVFLENRGLKKRMPTEIFLLERVIDLLADFHLYLEPPNAFTEIKDAGEQKMLMDELAGLQVAVREFPHLSAYFEQIAVLQDSLVNVYKMNGAKTKTVRNAAKQELRTRLIGEPTDPIAGVRHYLDIFERPAGTPSLELGGVKALIELVDAKTPHYSPSQLLSFHPQFLDVGKEVADKALHIGVDKTLRTRIFNVWPELAIPHLTSSLENLKGFGHDHTIELATRLVEDVRSRHAVQMLGVGDKMALLETEMREKLKDLYGKDRLEDLNKLFQTQNKSDQESPLDRMKEFQEGMSARKLSYGKVSILDFITFGTLKHQLWAHISTDKAKPDKPLFERTTFNKTELESHAVLVVAFRNAWAHHQTIESGFEKFDESYHFVCAWLRSLEKMEK